MSVKLYFKNIINALILAIAISTIKNKRKIVYIFSDTIFCGELLFGHLRIYEKVVVSGLSTNSDKMEHIFKILKIDFLIIFSNGPEFVRECLNHALNIPVIVVSLRQVEDRMRKEFPGKELSFIHLDQKVECLNEQLQVLISDGAQKQESSDERSYSFITRREKQVLKLIAVGKRNKEIASELFLSIKTIENHRNNILRKTSAKNMLVLINELTSIGFFK